MTYRPAETGEAPIFVMISGGTGTGKTRSALRLARGMVGPVGKIAALDLESGRLSTHAAACRFDSAIMPPPFRWSLVAQRAEDAEAGGYDALVIDSTSMAHVGPGGYRDWVEDEVTRLLERKARNTPGVDVADEFQRDTVRWMARRVPSVDRQDALYSFLQRRIPIIFVCRARRLTEKVGNAIKPLGWQPVIHTELPFEMTVSFILQGEDEKGNPPPAPGLITWEAPCKIDQAHRAIFPERQQVTEEMGARFMEVMRRKDSGPLPFEVLRSDGKVIGFRDLAGWLAWWDRALTTAGADVLKGLRSKNAERTSTYAEAFPAEVERLRRRIAITLGEVPPDDGAGEGDGEAGQGDGDGFPGDKPLPADAGPL